MIKISEITTVVTGGTPSKKNKEFWENGTIPWLQSGMCKNGYVDSCSKYITQAGLNNSSAKMMPAGTVIIALTGATVGKVGLMRIDACANQSVTGIIPCDSFLPLYMFYYLLRIRGKVIHDSYGDAQPHISQQYVKDIDIPLPPIPEQQRIVSRIEELFSSLDNAVETLQKTKEQLAVYRQAVLKELLSNDTWKKYTLGEIVTTEEGDRGKKYPKRSDYRSEGYCLFLSAQNVRPHGWNFEDTTFLTKEKHEELHGGTVQKGDVVITTRGTLGNVAVLDDSVPYEVLRINSCMLILRCNQDIVSPYYLSKFIMSPMFRQLIQKQKSGTAQPQIPANQLRELKIRVPSFVISKSPTW